MTTKQYAKAKRLFNQRQRCRFHRDQIAAVCPECYDAALEQQNTQRSAEQKEAHEQYLRRLGRAA